MPTDESAALRVKITYTNYRGETSTRIVVPIAKTLRFAVSPWHPEPQWLLDVWDLSKDEPQVRSLAVKDVSRWEPVS